jgi:hypothetical protein
MKNINKWNTKQEELKADVPTTTSRQPPGISAANLTPATKAAPRPAATTPVHFDISLFCHPRTLEPQCCDVR